MLAAEAFIVLTSGPDWPAFHSQAGGIALTKAILATQNWLNSRFRLADLGYEPSERNCMLGWVEDDVFGPSRNRLCPRPIVNEAPELEVFK